MIGDFLNHLFTVCMFVGIGFGLLLKVLGINAKALFGGGAKKAAVWYLRGRL